MMEFSKAIVSLTMSVCAMTLTVMAAEYVLPEGGIKSTVSVGTGILFLAAVIEKIAGIFTGGLV